MSEVLDVSAVTTVPLGELLTDIRNGLVVEQEKELPGIPITRIETISKGTVDMDRVRYVRDTAGKSLDNFWLKRGDILFSHINSDLHLGKTALVLSDAPLLHGMNLLRLRVDSSRLRPKYLHHWLDYCRRTGVFMAIAQHAVNQSSLNQKKITSLEVPLRAVGEQDEIVAELEKQFSRLDEAVANLQRVKANLKRYKASVLKAAVEGRSASLDESGASLSASGSLSELLGISQNVSGGKIRRGVPESVPLSEAAQTIKVPSGWRLRSVAELLRIGAIVDLKDGNHGANHPRTSDFVNAGLPFLTASEVVDFQIDYDGAYKVAGEPLAKLRVGFAEAGDVILTHKGTVGRVAICDRPCVLSPQTTYYRLKASFFSAQYFQYFLASHSFAIQLNAIKSQTTRDYVPISEQYRLFIVCPPLGEQARIVAEVDRQLSVIREVEAEVDTNLKRAQALRQATLANAFMVRPAE